MCLEGSGYDILYYSCAPNEIRYLVISIYPLHADHIKGVHFFLSSIFILAPFEMHFFKCSMSPF